MKKLAYIVAFGKDFYYQTGQLTIDSLIKTGFDGDIVALVDRDYQFKNASVIKMDTSKWSHKYDPHMARARLHHYVDVSKYDVVLYLDTDVICVSDTNEVFEETLKNNCFSVFTAPARLHKLWHYGTMRDDDKRKFLNKSTPSVCSGIYALPSSTLERDYDMWLDIFNERIKETDLFVCDQNILCELIYVNKLPNRLLPEKWLYYPKYHKDERGEEIFIHHCAQSKVKTKYKYLLDRLNKVP